MAPKIDATRPFYAVVGAGDLAVEYARTAATDVQARISKVDIEPKTLRDQARTVVLTRVEELTEEAKDAQAKLEARVVDLQADAKAFPSKFESYVNETVTTANSAYGDLASRGRDLVNRIRKQQATQDTKAAANTTVAKAKTTKTQTANSAKKTAGTTKSAARKTSSTAKSNVKATSTSAKKTASAGTDAASSAADKVGD